MIDRRHPLFRTVAATAAVAAVAVMWTAWGRSHSDALADAAGVGSAKGHYVVTLAFAPEGFHVTRLQAIGRLIEVQGRDIYMMDVNPAALRDVATAYWVRGVRQWPGR
jgi:hypothetical protein